MQVKGFTMEKARICLAEVQAKAIRRRPCWDERNDREEDNRILINFFQVFYIGMTSQADCDFYERFLDIFSTMTVLRRSLLNLMSSNDLDCLING